MLPDGRATFGVQKARPSQLILPVFVCRRRQWTLWDDSQRVGYLPAQVNNQLILPDNELDQATLQEVIDGLGFRDLRHRGSTHQFPHGHRP
jgi:hypothetical protein